MTVSNPKSADGARASALPDVTGLLREYRAVVVPAGRLFLEREISADGLRALWRPYYYASFHAFDLAVERAWREAAGSSGLLESGHPAADPALEPQLRFFPVSIAHNNLDRLIEVLAVELGDGTADRTGTPERIVDFAHVVDALDALMASLAAA
ncbi:hypothetical protein [Actinomadura rupiterrae]|uniref:hypothetical protein n=1 Tax=Actinomadura rupiterrae TaxID=559627 RepID=UPI0020A2F73F|nr:hypothetical protein [Actinomadura rupiterrae]MCP2335929.1 hypothetical protein [Actinomadura rupiterrae]